MTYISFIDSYIQFQILHNILKMHYLFRHNPNPIHRSRDNNYVSTTDKTNLLAMCVKLDYLKHTWHTVNILISAQLNLEQMCFYHWVLKIRSVVMKLQILFLCIYKLYV